VSVLVQPEEEVAVVLRGDFYMASVLLEQRLRSAGKRSDEVVGSGLVRESERERWARERSVASGRDVRHRCRRG